MLLLKVYVIGKYILYYYLLFFINKKYKLKLRIVNESTEELSKGFLKGMLTDLFS